MTRSAPGDTKSLSTFPSGILPLGADRPVLCGARTGSNANRNPSHLVPSTKMSLSSQENRCNRLCRKMKPGECNGATDENLESGTE